MATSGLASTRKKVFKKKKTHSAKAKFNRCSFAKLPWRLHPKANSIMGFLELVQDLARQDHPPPPTTAATTTTDPADLLQGSVPPAAAGAALTDKTFFSLRGSGEEILSGCSLRGDKMDSSTAPQNL